MTTTTNEQSVTKMDLAGGLAIVTVILLGGTWLFYGAIISAWLGTMATISIIGMGGAVAIGLIYATANGLILTTKKVIDTGYQVAFLNEELNMKRANTLYRHAEIQQAYANSELIRAESMAKTWAITEISTKRGALIMVNGQPTIIPPFEQQSAPAMLLADGGAEIAWDDSRLFDTFRQAKSPHGLIIGPRNSGKSTLLNGLMNEVFSGADITLIDPLFNKVESGWILPSGAKVTRDFIGGLTEFYGSHKKRADNATTKRDTLRKILVIDETPSLLKQLKSNDKKQYDIVMAMLRSIYSQGSHTSHNVILLSQTVLSEDLDLSSNDKANFIQVCLGSLAGDYLALRRGKANKKALYERLGAAADELDHYAIFEDNQGRIDVQPLPDLSQYGAKRLYGLSADSIEGESQADNDQAGQLTSEGIEGDSSGAMVVNQPSIFGLPEMSDYEKSVCDSAIKLIDENNFSLNKLHFALTGQKLSNGQYNQSYKEVMAKFGVKWQSQKVTS